MASGAAGVPCPWVGRPIWHREQDTFSVEDEEAANVSHSQAHFYLQCIWCPTGWRSKGCIYLPVWREGDNKWQQQGGAENKGFRSSLGLWDPVCHCPKGKRRSWPSCGDCRNIHSLCPINGNTLLVLISGASHRGAPADVGFPIQKEKFPTTRAL